MVKASCIAGLRARVLRLSYNDRAMGTTLLATFLCLSRFRNDVGESEQIPHTIRVLSLGYDARMVLRVLRLKIVLIAFWRVFTLSRKTHHSCLTLYFLPE